MRWLAAGVALAALFIVQLSLSGQGLLPAAPNLLLVYLCLGLAYWRLGDVLALAAVAGVLLDFFSALPDGVMLGSLVAAVLVSEIAIRTLFTASLGGFLPLAQTALATAAFFVAIMLTTQALALAGGTGWLDWSYMLARKLAPDLLANALAIYPVTLYFRFQAGIQARMGIRLIPKNEPV